MKLTRNEAIVESIKLWTFLAESGLDKMAYPKFAESGLEAWPEHGCYLCEYSRQLETRANGTHCRACPLPGEGEYRCEDRAHPWWRWTQAETTSAQKSAACDFLDVLRSCTPTP